jgi:hypothetical protein
LCDLGENLSVLERERERESFHPPTKDEESSNKGRERAPTERREKLLLTSQRRAGVCFWGLFGYKCREDGLM